MQWSGQQEQALKAINTWLGDKASKQVFYLAGYAGTGKTTLAQQIAKDAGGDVAFGAFTGKAAQVMRRKGCRGAKTIHSLIYKLKEEADLNGQPVFEIDRLGELKGADLCIIDECSMIDETIGKDLLSFGVKILVIGDPAQLPPIKGAGLFTSGEPDFMLTEIHRQARDNPIIGLSMKIRAGEALEPGNFGATRLISREEITPEEILACDQVLVGLNRTRHLYNQRIRELKDRVKFIPEIGDKLICLRNDRKLGIFNGSMWEAERVRKPKKKPVFKIDIVAIDGDSDSPARRTVEVREEFFNGTDAALPWQQKKGTQEFTFGYAITCHKSQGSQWNDIIVFNESGAFREDARRWLYTAVTRAAEKLTLIL